MIKQSKHVNFKNRILTFFFVFPFLQPDVLNFVSNVHRFFVVWQVINLVALLVLYLFEKRLSVFFLMMILWRFYIFLLSYFKQGTIGTTSLNRTVFIFGIVLVIEIGFRKNALDTLWGIYLVAILISILNLLSCLKGGVLIHNNVEYFVYGLRTRFTDSAIPLTVLAMLISWLKNKRIFSGISIFTIILVGFQLVYEWVATGIFALILIVSFCLLGSIFKFKLFPKTTFLAGLAFVILVVFYRIQNYFSFIIVDLLHKTLDFHGRIPIWDIAIDSFKSSPVFGFGENQTGRFIKVWWSETLAPAHDMILQVLHDGGLISAMALFVIYMYAVSRLAKYNVDIEIKNILTIAVLATCFAILTEITSYYSYFYILPAICANIEKIGTIKYGGFESSSRKTYYVRNKT
ncbi:O-antigen ligase family protein [Companilactobacillus futsaii]|uniref:O-antigen ligase family protein n=1 Tax=Companilactobacillus futsaii TaxID=938155 RepID=UPI001E2DBEFB|nr:O-antigen ligase family protein [Companilactobacillus futsaii]